MDATPSNTATPPSGFDPTKVLAHLRETGRRLRRRFARRRSVIQTRVAVELLESASIQSQWIVARSLCMYRSEDFAGVPRNRRDAAVALRIPVWSPFERGGHYCAWSGTTAMVWFWDETAVVVDPARLGVPRYGAPSSDASSSGVRVLPETVLYPEKVDGVHLQECREGFDLQYWRDGVLVDSLWLAARPTTRRVAAFVAQHDGGSATDDGGGATVREVPTTVACLAPGPWATPFRPQAWLVANEHALAVTVFAVLAAVAAFQEARLWRYHFANASATAQYDNIERQLVPVLEARDELLGLDRRNAFLTRVMQQPSQAELMLRVDRALPGQAIQFKSWQYRQGDLTVVLSNSATEDPVAIIANLQADPLFTEVRPGRSDKDGFAVSLRIAMESNVP